MTVVRAVIREPVLWLRSRACDSIEIERRRDGRRAFADTGVVVGRGSGPLRNGNVCGRMRAAIMGEHKHDGRGSRGAVAFAHRPGRGCGGLSRRALAGVSPLTMITPSSPRPA